MSESTTVNLHFYGLDLQLRSDDTELVDGMRRDFAYFKAGPVAPAVRIDVFNEQPPFGSLPDLKATIYTTGYISYWGKEEVYTDYYGRGLRIFNQPKKGYRIYSLNADLRYEIAYLTVLEGVGRYLDSQHIHRIHALGIARNGKAILILLPEKGGKSTLALSLLRSGKVSLIAADAPLLTRSGMVLPYPLHIGIPLLGELEDIPESCVRQVFKTRSGNNTIIDVDYFADKIASPCQPGAILLGERVLSNASKIEPASKLSAGVEFIRISVIGLGIHQGLEYILGRNVWSTLGNTGLALSRLNNSIQVLRRSRIYRFLIGHDTEKNAETLLTFLDGLDL